MKRTILILLAVALMLSLLLCGCKSKSEKAPAAEEQMDLNDSSAKEDDAEKEDTEELQGCVDDWKKSLLNSVLPLPKSGQLDDFYEFSESISISVLKVSADDFNSYVKACEKKGFTVEEEFDDDRFEAYNSDGYELVIKFYPDDKEYDIDLTIPKKLGGIQWPTFGLATKVPQPESKSGSIEWDSSDFFCVEIGETSIDDFNLYIQTCLESGFDVDYYKDESYYGAYNKDGDYLSVSYIGNNVMEISIEAPYEEDEETTKEDDSESEKASEQTSSSTEIRPEFKEAMDSYEEFFDEYADFMKKISDNPSDFTLLADYATYVAKATEMEEKMAAWEDDDLNEAELAYYLEVTARIEQKLLTVY